MFLASRIVVLALALLVVGCAGAAPQVKVLGVTESQAAVGTPSSRTLLVFLEVVNPSGVDLQLSKLRYRMDAPSWFRADGEVPLSRAVGAQSAVVVEVPVQFAGAARESAEDLPYTLQGTLYAVDRNRVEKSWKVNVTGVIPVDDSAAARARVRTRVADGQ